MNPKLKDSNVEYLYKAVLSLETMEECDRFFDDLCTVPELKAISQRLQVAKMLWDHRVYSGWKRWRGMRRPLPGTTTP